MFFIVKISYAYIPKVFGINLTILSSLACRIYHYFNYGLDAFSPWCLVYISVERFVSIAHPTKRFILKKKRNQIYYFLILCVFNTIYHINVPLSFDTFYFYDNNNNNSMICFFNSDENQIIVTFMDLVNFILLPFLLMIIFSTLLTLTVFKSRGRLNDSLRENKNFRKDAKLSISLLAMNLLFMLLTLPDEIDLFLPFNNDIYQPLAQLCNLSFSVNFFVILSTNSLFRKEFISLFVKKRSQTQIIRELEIKRSSTKQIAERPLYN